jgi:hypothetical protein
LRLPERDLSAAAWEGRTFLPVFVSVLIDTCNHERFIEQAISSVLAQEFPASDFEVIVVDDGSADHTAEIVRRFEPRLRLLQKTNGGQASAFNTGIPQCRGEIIAFLDGDDWWAPRKLRRVAELFAADSSIGFVGHAIVESYADGAERLVSPGREHRFRLDSADAAKFFRLNRCYMGTSRMTIRTSIARKLLPVPESLVIEADEYLFTLAPLLADAMLLPEPLTHYRLHGGNLYMASGSVAGGERRMQRVFASLAAELRQALPRYGASPEAAGPILEMVEAQAAQLRLKLDGGSSWETFRTESCLYQVQHADANWRSRVFRNLSMIPALLLPPRWFYGGRQWIGSQSWYRKLRRSYVPLPQLGERPPVDGIR